MLYSPVVIDPMKKIGVILALTLLTACSSGVPVTRYTLPVSSYIDEPQSDGVLVLLSPVELPEYAQEKAVATQGEGAVVIHDASRRWAGYPQDVITQSLVSALRRQGVNAWNAASLPAGQPHNRLLIRFDTFLRSTQGGAVMRGTILMSGAESASMAKRFELEVPGSKAADSYSSFFNASVQGLDQISKAAASLIREPQSHGASENHR